MPTQTPDWLSQAERIAHLKGQVFFWRFMFWTTLLAFAGLFLCFALLAREVIR